MDGLNSIRSLKLLTFCDNLPQRKRPLLKRIHLCIAFHEDAYDSNEFVLAVQHQPGIWLLVMGGTLVLPADVGYSITQWAELPDLNAGV